MNSTYQGLMRVPLALFMVASLVSCAHRDALSIAYVYEINDWQASCGGRKNQVFCEMAKKVTGVGNFRVVWLADKVTLSELTCRSADRWEETEFSRQGEVSKLATAIHNRIQETVEACNREAIAEVDDTLEVASLLARVTD